MTPTSSLDELIEALRCLPGVGPKSAQRMAYHLLQRDRNGADRLARGLDAALQLLHGIGRHVRGGAEHVAVCPGDDDGGHRPSPLEPLELDLVAAPGSDAQGQRFGEQDPLRRHAADRAVHRRCAGQQDRAPMNEERVFSGCPG